DDDERVFQQPGAAVVWRDAPEHELHGEQDRQEREEALAGHAQDHRELPPATEAVRRRARAPGFAPGWPADWRGTPARPARRRPGWARPRVAGPFPRRTGCRR